MAAMLRYISIVREWQVKKPQAIGKSRAGNTTKIHLAVDGYGLPVEFEITGGEVNDCSAAPDLIAKLADAEAIVADNGYDSEWTDLNTNRKCLLANLASCTFRRPSL